MQKANFTITSCKDDDNDDYQGYDLYALKTDYVCMYLCIKKRQNMHLFMYLYALYDHILPIQYML